MTTTKQWNVELGVPTTPPPNWPKVPDTGDDPVIKLDDQDDLDDPTIYLNDPDEE